MNRNQVTLIIKPVKLVGGGHLTAAIVAEALARPLWSTVGSATARTLLSSVVGEKAVIRGRTRYLSGVAVVNASTVTIRLTHTVTRGFLKNLANPALAIVPVNDMERGGANWQWLNLYGTGGYRMTNWVPNGLLSLSRVSGRGPQTVDLQIFSSFKAATLAFQNGGVEFVPVSPDQVARVPRVLRGDIRALPMPGDLSLVYRSGAKGVSAYPHLSIQRWVDKSFEGRIQALSGQWPASMRAGKPMTVYVSGELPEAVRLAKTLARLEPGRVTVRQVSEATLASLAKRGLITAYIGRANLFKSGQTVPLAPMRSLWLASAFSHAAVYANGALNWHSLVLGN